MQIPRHTLGTGKSLQHCRTLGLDVSPIHGKNQMIVSLIRFIVDDNTCMQDNVTFEIVINILLVFGGVPFLLAPGFPAFVFEAGSLTISSINPTRPEEA